MRDIHYDAEFMDSFKRASKNWSWATWHKLGAEKAALDDEVSYRLLRQVFGENAGGGEETPDGTSGSGA